MPKKNNLVLINEENIKDKIYIIRGQKVMLDKDLAEIYGYTTKAFNQQIKNNINRFPSDFMFKLTGEEIDRLSRSKIFTSIMQSKGIKGGRVYLPYAFSESGIYMLMTVLKGPLAVKQSIMLIRLFKGMKDTLNENGLLPGQILREIELKTLKHDQDIKQYKDIIKRLQNNKELLLKQ